MLLVCLALLALAALSVYPLAEAASVELRPAEVENARKLLGESPTGQRAIPSSRASAQDGMPGTGTMTLSVPKLGLEYIPMPTADIQVALDREGILFLEEAGVPRKEDSNTVVLGHALGFLYTKLPYVFYSSNN